MKSAPILLALVAICASGFAIPPQPIPNRTETVPLAEPIHITVDQLALPDGHDKDFKDFNESLIPEAIKRLNGKRVVIVGQMNWLRPGPVASFEFNGYSNQKPDPLNPPFQFFIRVTLTSGVTTRMTSDPIEIEGRLVIRPFNHNGKLRLIYAVEDASVEPTERPEGYTIPVMPFLGC